MTHKTSDRDFLSSRLADCLETLREGVQIIGFDWRYLYVNQAVCRHGRRSRDELLGRTMMEVYPGVEQTEMYAVLRACMADRRPRELENDFTYSDGSKAHFQLRVEPCPEGLFVLSLDTTERERLQLQLRWAQKMDAVGRLASGIAHDFNNVLSAVLGLSSFALRTVGDQHPAAQDLRDVADTVERGSGLARQLLAFANADIIAARPVDVNDAVRQFHRVLERLVRDRIRITLRLAEEAWRTVIDPGALDQVLLNLVLNARDALPEGGHITIETAAVAFTEQAPLSEVAAGAIPAGEYVTVAVSDDGIGMTAEVRERMFDPFFTTKPPDQGTGLGLATCYGIVRGAGGHIAVFSEPGQGTTVRIYLPRSTGVLPFVRRPRPEAPSGGTETVLIVDDSEIVRAVSARALREAGYHTEIAEGPAEALAIAALSPRIDLLVSELRFPNGSGRDLASDLARIHPEANVLYVSGHSELAMGHRGGLPPGTSFLAKPFSPSALAHKVRDVLDTCTAKLQATGSDDAVPFQEDARAVLVAEGDEISRRMIRRQVLELGYRVVVADDREDIVRRAVETRPAVLVIDMQAPHIDGPAVLRRLALTGVDAGIVVTTSGDAGSGDVIAALRAGAVDCLQKPWTDEELRGALERAAAVFEAAHTA